MEVCGGSEEELFQAEGIASEEELRYTRQTERIIAT